MDRSIPPSARLAARLAAAGEPKAPADALDERARHFIGMAEDVFKDPLQPVTALWNASDGQFILTRVAYEFSEYEAFVFKLAMVFGGLGYIDRPAAELLAATACYAGGKAQVRRQGPLLFSELNDAYHKLNAGFDGRGIPKPLAQHATFVSDVVRAQRATKSAALGEWLSRHVGAAPGALEYAGNSFFTEQSGPYTLGLGQLPNGKTLYYRGEASLLTIAPPGKGKTQCHVLPTLASYRGAVIALDIKGECYEQTAEWRANNVGPVYRFNPVEPDESHRYNPLALVDSNEDEIWESSRFLADLLVVVRSQNDSTWETQGKDLLTLIIAFVTLTNPDVSGRRMTEVLDLMATIGLSDMLEMVASREVDGVESPFPATMRRAAARFSKMERAAPKQFEGILSGATQHLQVWDGPKVERVTSACDWHPDHFRDARPPSLYLCIPPNALETYAPLLRVIVGQHVRRLMRSQPQGGTPILFLLDELPRLGRMEPVREALEVGRSYGIRLWMIAQYAEQLLQAYPGVGEGMMESCDVRMYMNPSPTNAERVIRTFGAAKNVLSGSKKTLLELEDILGPSHRDSIFVLAANEKPQILRKRFFHAGRA